MASAASMKRLIPRRLRAMRAFLLAERNSPHAFSEVSFVRRGFQSDRRWLYADNAVTTPGYVSDLRFITRIGELNPPSARNALRDKLSFEQLLGSRGGSTSTPLTYGVMRHGAYSPHGTEDTAAGPVIVKPIDGSAGEGLAAYESLDLALEKMPRDRTYLVQKRLLAHDTIARIFPESLNVLRVQTARLEAGSAPFLVAAVQRFGTGRVAPGDAFTPGGLVAAVTTDGVLTTAVGPPDQPARMERTHHPDTGARIEGVRVPFFEEAIELALHAMRILPDAVYIGWDIGVLPDGPIILEGNASWPNLPLLQTHRPVVHDEATRRLFSAFGML